MTQMKTAKTFLIIVVMLMALVLMAAPLWAEDDAELVKKLSNPVANLISVPLQNNWDFGIGPEKAMRYTLNIQPVIPISIGKDWNLITRSIVPIIHAEAPVKGLDDSTGLGDILQSFFFSPKEPTSGGWIWGVGPVILYPSGTDELSAHKWGAGPTAVLLKQESGWTYGILANHVWSFSGGGENDISATFLQPFLTYATKKQTSFTLNTESTYDWEESQWTVPINFGVAQLVKISGLPMQFQAVGRVYAERPDGGPNWGLRFAVTFLFPK
jgi:hypothetical protein